MTSHDILLASNLPGCDIHVKASGVCAVTHLPRHFLDSCLWLPSFSKQPPNITSLTHSSHPVFVNVVDTMPELLDLPPELIELIFNEHDALKYQEQEDTGDNKTTAPLFRLTSRYIEQCTRRTFAATYFDTWHVKTLDAASLQSFYAMTRATDLARYVETLMLYVGDDRSAQHLRFSAKRSEFVGALRACVGVVELMILTTPGDHADETRQEVDDEASVEAPTTRSIFDMSSSFAYALSLAEEANMRPMYISTSSGGTRGHVDYGLADCAVLAKPWNVLLEVEELRLEFVPDRLAPIDTLERL